jgi:hypothetical protein
VAEFAGCREGGLMAAKVREPDQALTRLRKTVADAATFLADVDEEIFDGYQTARQVLSHLVFWHREYVSIVQALADGRKPLLQNGTYAELNAGACCEFEKQTMVQLARRLLILQESLEAELVRFTDWEMNFPIKHGSRRKTVAKRLPNIEAHVRNHVNRLRRAERLGEAWIRAYYTETA